MEKLTLEKFSDILKIEGYCGIACNNNGVQLYAYTPLCTNLAFRNKISFHKPRLKKYNLNFTNNYEYIDFKLDRSLFKEIYGDFKGLPKHLKRNFKKHLRLFIKKYSALDREDVYRRLKAL